MGLVPVTIRRWDGVVQQYWVDDGEGDTPNPLADGGITMDDVDLDTLLSEQALVTEPTTPSEPKEMLSDFSGEEKVTIPKIEPISPEAYKEAQSGYKTELVSKDEKEKSLKREEERKERFYQDRLRVWRENTEPAISATGELIREDVYTGMKDLGFEQGRIEDEDKEDIEKGIDVVFLGDWDKHVFFKDGSVDTYGYSDEPYEDSLIVVRRHASLLKFTSNTLNNFLIRDRERFYPNGVAPPMVTISQKVLAEAEAIKPRRR